MTDAEAREIFRRRYPTAKAQMMAELHLQRAWRKDMAKPRHDAHDKPPPPRGATRKLLADINAYVHRKRGVTQGDVAQRFGIEPDRASDLLGQLVTRGYITRDNSQGVSIWDGVK